MRAYHDSRELKFRDPFGAVPMGGAVSISIDTWDGEPQWVELKLRASGGTEEYITMDRSGGRFTCTVKLDAADIYWYSFICHFPDGGVCWYGPARGRVGGIGEIYGWDCPEYQITSYKPRAVPDWYSGGICYQIFPDRFFRGEDWRENAESVLSKPRNGVQKKLIERWSTPVSYRRGSGGRIKEWGFYGGTLLGIEEKLDYLKGLGVTVLYLNPIFEAVSCHRYDTGDYEKIDGMLGGPDSFRRLADAAAERGIRIILDGVFNHVGCDSKYFNKFGNYPEPGAFQGPESKYYDWFRFDDSPAGYECWWGIDDLPDVEEGNRALKDYIYAGKDSIVRRWLRAGAGGWRLDVADELPDSFIEGIKTAMVEELGGDALLMGEVWEDASHKISYGQLRRYLLGSELDTVMNYPFRTGVLDFLTWRIPAWDLQEALMALKENYPRETFNALFNLMGSHDRPRVLTVLGDAPDPDSMTEAQRGAYRLPEDRRGLAKSRLWLMSLLQMTLPGVPCVYYGDEAGMEGYSDPFNRGTYPWGREDRDCFTIYRNAINLRRSFQELADADFEPMSFGADVFGFCRLWEGGGIAVLVNRGGETQHVTIGRRGEDVTDILGGTQYDVRGESVDVTLWPMGSAILYFHKKERLGAPLRRGMGVLAHITSLPDDSRQGNIGRAAFDFVDFLHGCGVRYWQILPLNPTDMHGSPYAGVSAFAGNTALLPLTEEELREEFAAFSPENGEYREFLRENMDWLRPYALFMALKKRFDGAAFTEWPEDLRRYDPNMSVTAELAGEYELQLFAQFKFEKYWHELRAYARERGVTIIGDMPMYVSGDSADVWAEPENFAVDARGRAELVAGVPPSWQDPGQLWGNPMYDWQAQERDGYSWWMRRFRRMLDLYDFVRLDHFMGFESGWAIPSGKGPGAGHWVAGPGLRLFERAYEKFGPLPFVAEDLGSITPAIRALLARCGFLGTDVMQYQSSDPMDGCFPAKEKIAYTGTHDNMTLMEYCQSRYRGRDGAECVRTLLRRACESSADVVIAQLQDVLELGGEARMNTPGTTAGNWSWQAKWSDFKDASQRLSSYIKNTDRS